jgi:hypothetical protein
VLQARRATFSQKPGMAFPFGVAKKRTSRSAHGDARRTSERQHSRLPNATNENNETR